MSIDPAFSGLQVGTFERLQPEEILQAAIDTYSPDIGIAFSGAEDVVLIDMAARNDKPFRVFALDTGRLHPETYRFLDRVRKHYGIELEIFFPKSEALESLVAEKGLFSFYDDGHQQCCAIRKVEPLRRALAPLAAWVTGQRRDQSLTRVHVPVMETDIAFSRSGHQLVKFNPLASWTSSQAWAYIRDRNLPYNELHERGFVSIGCEPCTRPTLPQQHEREGRWWWENSSEKECGLHGGNNNHRGSYVVICEKRSA
jgi:phosphoadenosine phosphosulfate reductase